MVRTSYVVTEFQGTLQHISYDILILHNHLIILYTLQDLMIRSLTIMPLLVTVTSSPTGFVALYREFVSYCASLIH